MDSGKKPRRLRSQEWFGREGKDGFLHRSWIKNQGYPDDLFDGRPVIGICNTWSELTPCNGHFRELAEFVKRGVLEAGGFPLEFPVMSLGETQLKPTAMLFRNLASMDVEESIRGNPIDGVVLLMGCDKTTPSLIMGAAMFFQQRLNPAPADPVQAKVMQIMPIVFTGFFAFFPSGLVIYWVTNTLLSIAQQWRINKVVAAESGKRKSSKKETRKKESAAKGSNDQ